LFAKVDDEDYDYLMQWRWQAHRSNSRTYIARRTLHNWPKTKTIYMHRIIMNTSPDLQVDHIDHDGLNNQKYNLRNCTSEQNVKNVLARGEVKYLGVNYKRDRGYVYIQSRIWSNGKSIYLGSFKTLEDAAMAYDRAAKIYHKEFANLNFK